MIDMGFTEPDTPPSPPQQMPQATTPGPAGVPYAGPGFALAPSMLAPMADISAGAHPGAQVMDGTPGHLPEAPLAAPDVMPYYAGAVSPVYVGGDADAGGRDTVAGSVAGAVHNAEARFGELQGDTYGEGSHIGDLMSFPPSPLDPGAGAGLTDPEGHYYTPPRLYGGNEPA